ncbi:helix-turn-helix domain-containing protein [Deinococcus sp. JMULE3]|uniref:RodZ domain-containing protein n=1 Tax=Deinococcus sp. JMULE3 TaxID=2518341 RepID=UPI001576421B|nr:helix-turn-helix domain-containing protein [Deinococcus sp. JMULE3]
MTSFGAALRQAREGLGLSTQDAALRTKIRGDYLRALEDGNLSALPERTFARSYLTRYARELGLDPQPLLSDFDRVMPAPAGSSYVTPALPARRPNRALWAAAGVAALLAVGGAAFMFTRSAPAPQEAAAPVVTPDQPAPPAVRTVRLTVKVTPPGARVYLDNRDLGAAPIVAFPVDARQQAELRVELAGRQPLRQAIDVGRNRDLRVILKPTGQTSVLSDAAQPTPTSASTSSAATPQPSASPAGGTLPAGTSPAKPPASQGVTVTYSGPSWTRVTDAAGRIVFEGTPAAGTVKTFAKGVTIRTGNAAAVRVSVNGGPGTPLGQSGQVVTRTF